MKNLYYLFILSFLLISCEEEVPPVTYTLTTQVTPTGAGTVNPSSGTYDEGESVTISATPSANYNFKQWTGTGSGTANPLTFKIISNTTVTAEFELIDTDGDGVTDDIDTCPDTPDGEIVDENGCTVPPKQFMLTVELLHRGYGGLFEINDEMFTSTTEKLFDSGSVVVLKAIESIHSEFQQWFGSINDNQKYENTIQVTIDADKYIKVLFLEPEYEPFFYLDGNGVTIKINEHFNVEPGITDFVDGVEYTAVDREMLISMVQNGDDVTKVVTSLITNMRDIFSKKNSFNQDISSWDVSNVTDMGGMFYEAINFNQDISFWDVSNVTDMKNMFGNTDKFNQNISNWDVSKVTNMSEMFSYAKSFNQDLSIWVVDKVLDCSSFKLNADSYILPIPNFTSCNPN